MLGLYMRKGYEVRFVPFLSFKSVLLFKKANPANLTANKVLNTFTKLNDIRRMPSS